MHPQTQVQRFGRKLNAMDDSHTFSLLIVKHSRFLVHTLNWSFFQGRSPGTLLGCKWKQPCGKSPESVLFFFFFTDTLWSSCPYPDEALCQPLKSSYLFVQPRLCTSTCTAPFIFPFGALSNWSVIGLWTPSCRTQLKQKRKENREEVNVNKWSKAKWKKKENGKWKVGRTGKVASLQHFA